MNQTQTIAYYSPLMAVLCVGFFGGGGAFLLYGVFHPEIFTNAKHPIFTTVIGAIGAGMAALLVYDLIRNRGRAVWIADGQLFLPPSFPSAPFRQVPVQDIAKVTWGTETAHTEMQTMRLKTIEIHDSAGGVAAVRTVMLAGHREDVLARLNDALARHRAAGGPAATP